ncbi:hypothetical protein JHS3_01610 [Jeongeupia sp. HS-3]|nr:hypothetical protein [Jeongeupia sp. HS-3]BCL74425.1 hypothetical protein JHS3_01610 [Jeongeupia sp. HS-3]
MNIPHLPLRQARWPIVVFAGWLTYLVLALGWLAWDDAVRAFLCR